LLKLYVGCLQTFLPEVRTSSYTTVPGLGISRNVIVSGYVTFAKSTRFSYIYYFFIIDKISSRAEFGLQTVWGPLLIS